MLAVHWHGDSFVTMSGSPDSKDGKQVTVTSLFASCQQTILGQSLATSVAMSPAVSGYRPTISQIAYFALVWATKQGAACRHVAEVLHDKQGHALSVELVQQHIEQVSKHLAEWGSVLTKLQRKDAHEWELLRIQMEKAIARYHCPEQDKEDALHDALIKVWRMVDQAVGGQALDTVENATELVEFMGREDRMMRGGYDFSSPFYSYARRMVENELISKLRRHQRELKYRVELDEMTETVVESSSALASPPPEIPEEMDLAASRVQLRIDLTRLLDLISNTLTPKAQQVVLLTLAARPQFWLALDVVGMLPPPDLPNLTENPADVDLGQRLGMSDNSLRVHRSLAKAKITETQPLLGVLLETLMERALLTSETGRI